MEKKIDQRLIYRKYGFSFSIGMVILLAISFWRNFSIYFKGLIVLLLVYHLFCALFFQQGLKPFYKAITSIATKAGNFLSGIIFTVVFYLLFTPIALVLRLSGKDQIEKVSKSLAWMDVEEKDNDPGRIKHLY